MSLNQLQIFAQQQRSTNAHFLEQIFENSVHINDKNDGGDGQTVREEAGEPAGRKRMGGEKERV